MHEQEHAPYPEDQSHDVVRLPEYPEPLPVPTHEREIEPIRRQSLGRRLLGRLVRLTNEPAERDVDDALLPVDPNELASDESGALSVNANQLRQLSLVGPVVREYENRLYGSHMSDARVDKKAGMVSHKLEEAILSGDVQSALKAIGKLPIAKDERTQTLIDALQSREKLSFHDVLGQTYDHNFLRFLGSSSRVRRHTAPPASKSSYIIPEVGIHATITPTDNILEVDVNNQARAEKVRLPLSEQNVSWIDDTEVYGTSEESTAAHRAVFAELAKRASTVFTHHTGLKNLPGFLESESWGKSSLRGPDAHLHNLSGLYTEEAQLADPAAYSRQDMPVLRADGTRGFTSAVYVHAEDPSPVILFSHDMPEYRQTHKNPIGIGIVGETQFDDPSLIGILVTPTYKANLLDWIGSWPQPKRDQIFKGRDPQTLLISSAEDLV